MLNRFFLVIFAMSVFAMAHPVFAQSMIQCPTGNIDARVVTKLPSDWWLF